jgi:hypothetical protein
MRIIYIKTLICFLGLIGLVSCENYLEEQPISTVLLEEVNKSNLDAILTGIYEPLTRSRGRAWESHLSRELMLLEESIKGRSGSNLRKSNYEVDLLNANNWWVTLYQSIGRANSLLAALENSDLDDDLKDKAKGEALFVRSFVYFTLVRLHGEIPLRLTPVTNSDVTGQRLEPIANIYDQLISDLKLAENLLDPTTTRPGSATAGAAKVMLADIYLTIGSFPEAASKAKEVIDNASTYGYNLLPNFSDVFSPTADTHEEDVFSLKFSQSVGLGTFVTVYWAPRTADYAKKGGVAPRGLENGGVITAAPLIAGWDDNDLRKQWSLYKELEIDGVTTNVVSSNNYEFLLGKYRDPGSVEETASGNDWFAYRYADALLIFAEADNLAKGAPSDEAYDAVNKIRRRAYGVDLNTANPTVDLPAGLSNSDFDARVFEERGYEFLGEGKRWFDLLRTEKYKTILPAAGYDMPTQLIARIPGSELSNNDKITP